MTHSWARLLDLAVQPRRKHLPSEPSSKMKGAVSKRHSALTLSDFSSLLFAKALAKMPFPPGSLS